MTTQSNTGSSNRGTSNHNLAPFAVLIDAAFVTLFVTIGRRNHDEETGLGALVETAAPFLIALAVAWAVGALALGAWRRPLDVRVGAFIWVVVIALGMLLRRTVFDRGTALSFVIVATLFLGVFLVGWRAVATLVERRRAAT